MTTYKSHVSDHRKEYMTALIADAKFWIKEEALNLRL